MNNAGYVMITKTFPSDIATVFVSISVNGLNIVSGNNIQLLTW